MSIIMDSWLFTVFLKIKCNPDFLFEAKPVTFFTCVDSFKLASMSSQCFEKHPCLLENSRFIFKNIFLMFSILIDFFQISKSPYTNWNKWNIIKIHTEKVDHFCSFPNKVARIKEICIFCHIFLHSKTNVQGLPWWSSG